MKRVIIVNICVCLIFSIGAYIHFKNSAGIAVAYNYSVQYAVENFDVKNEDIEEASAKYQSGMGWYSIMLKEKSTSKVFAFEVQLDKNFFLLDFDDVTREYETYKK